MINKTLANKVADRILDAEHVERSTRLSARFYETREFLRQHADEDVYKDTIATFIGMITQRTHAFPNEAPLDAALELTKFLERQGKQELTGWVIAAVVELIERDDKAAGQ